MDDLRQLGQFKNDRNFLALLQKVKQVIMANVLLLKIWLLNYSIKLFVMLTTDICIYVVDVRLPDRMNSDNCSNWKSTISCSFMQGFVDVHVHFFWLTAPITWVNDRWFHDHVGTVVIRPRKLANEAKRRL